MNGAILKSSYVTKPAPGGYYTLLNGTVIAFTTTKPQRKEVTQELFVR